MKIQKSRFSLSTKLNCLILVIILLLSLGLTLIAYDVNRQRVDRLYMQNTANAANTVGAYMDGDWFEGFLEMLTSPEYKSLREHAMAEDDEDIIRDYLIEQGFYDEYLHVCSVLSEYRDRLGVTYVYTATLEGEGSIAVIDPDEGLLYMGSYFDLPPEFRGIEEGRVVEPTVSRTASGWFCSAYQPFFSSKADFVGFVGVDIDMNEVMAEREAFLFRMIIFSAGLLLVSIAAAVFLMRKIATKPLQMLTEATVGFGDSAGENGFDAKDIIDLPIENNDEIGDLYHVIQNMQRKIVEYLDNLTRVTAEKERIGAELNIATQIQANMLPRIFPPFPGRNDFDIYASMIPAKEVGGDFYDFFLIDDDHIGLVMADVSGKGVPAALFMVIAKTLIKNRAQMGGGPAEILNYVNTQLCEGNETQLFVTVWLAIVELSTGKGLASNAGHEHPVIRRADGKYELVVYRHTPAVAVMENTRFREHSFQLQPGDTLFVYTDGVTEATNAGGEFFGTDKLLEALNLDPDGNPETKLYEVKSAIDSFVGEAPQFDDITMMCFHYNGPRLKNVRKLTIDASVDNLEHVLAFVNQGLEKAECPMKTLMHIDVAVEELFVNIASYAYAPGTGKADICMGIDQEQAVAEITFIDSGIPYDPLAKEDPDITLPAEKRKIGGLGIYMAKKSMDNISYIHRDGKNILTIRKKL